ncbi:hypothetical protein [Nautilia sp.]
MPNYVIESRKAFQTQYLKVKLKDNSKLEKVKILLSNLQSVKKANITKNKRPDITVYPSEFYSLKETEDEIRIQLDSIFETKTLDPFFEKEKFSSISDKAYNDIINEINIFGLNLEKYKNLYSKFNEEGFRDFFLPHLNSISKSYTATGETFNKKGKTDILVQDKEGNNVFIAECKIWYGEQELLKAIDQLLERYVTWRDDKTALIIFNKHNKNFTQLLITAKEAVKKHPQFDSIVQESKKTFSYIFKNIDDPQKKIYLELMIFNCI